MGLACCLLIAFPAFGFESVFTSYFKCCFLQPLHRVYFDSPPLFRLASLLISSDSNISGCTLKEGRSLRGPPTAGLVFLTEFRDLGGQCNRAVRGSRW